MPKDTNISIIQLIKSGEISVSFEISNVRANRDINVYVRTYLEKSDHYTEIQQHISQIKADMQKAKKLSDKLHFDQKLQTLYKVEEDFIANTLYLAETLSKIEPRTEKLKKAIALFEETKIREADTVLAEADLLDDQFNLITYVEYQEKKIQNLENDINSPLN